MLAKLFSFILYLSLLFILFLFPILKIAPLLASSTTFRESWVHSHLDKNAARRLNHNILAFLKGREALDEAFMRNERNHMEDVKNLFILGETVFTISLCISLINILILYALKESSKTIKALEASGATILIVGTLVLGCIAFNFQNSFMLFHEWFFPQGNWSFPMHSLIIQLYPSSFFMAIGQLVFACMWALGAICWFLSFAMRRKWFRSFQTLF